MKIVYSIVKRGEKTYWNRIGVAFVNRDGSLNVRLDAFPVNGEMHIRDAPDTEVHKGYCSANQSDDDIPFG